MEEAPSRGGSHKNEKEAAVVCAHIQELLKTGLREQEIAVITPYNGQKELLQEHLREQYPHIDIKSVDGFQGGEREAVVMSLVRSNERREVGFLADTRRINVAITRARRHVAIVGDSDCVSTDPFISGLLDHISMHGEHRSALEYLPNEATTATVSSDVIVQATAEKGGHSQQSIPVEQPKSTRPQPNHADRSQPQTRPQPQQRAASRDQNQQTRTTVEHVRREEDNYFVPDAQIEEVLNQIVAYGHAFNCNVTIDGVPLVQVSDDGWITFSRHLKPGQRR